MIRKEETAQGTHGVHQLSTRAKLGAHWLDEHYGGIEWAGHVNITELYMLNPRRGVLDQLADSSEVDLKTTYGLTVEDAISLGLFVEDDRMHDGSEADWYRQQRYQEDWCVLASAWFKEIQSRQHQLVLVAV